MPPKKQAPFIVIEALDAGGSQTQTDLLSEHLTAEGIQVLPLHFPQEDRATGQLIYNKFLLEKNKQPFTPREQALLYIQDFYSRAEDIKTWLKSSGRRAVLSDRYYTSTLAYQTITLSGRKRRERLAWLAWLCSQGKPQLPQPTAVIFLDTPVAVSLRRLSGKPKDFFEAKDKLMAIRRSYRMAADDYGWHIINSVDQAGKERSREELHKEIWQLVTPLVGLKA